MCVYEKHTVGDGVRACARGDSDVYGLPAAYNSNSSRPVGIAVGSLWFQLLLLRVYYYTMCVRVNASACVCMFCVGIRTIGRRKRQFVLRHALANLTLKRDGTFGGVLSEVHRCFVVFSVLVRRAYWTHWKSKSPRVVGPSVVKRQYVDEKNKDWRRGLKIIQDISDVLGFKY